MTTWGGPWPIDARAAAFSAGTGWCTSATATEAGTTGPAPNRTVQVRREPGMPLCHRPGDERYWFERHESDVTTCKHCGALVTFRTSPISRTD